MVKQIELSQGKYAVVDEADYEFLSQHKWSLNHWGYAVRRHEGKTIFMHRVVLNTPQGLETDHINGDKLDNRRSNLRACTHQQNLWNSRSRKGASSPHKGVGWHKFAKKWQAYIKVNTKSIHLGYHATEEQAAEAYREASKRYFGEFAHE